VPRLPDTPAEADLAAAAGGTLVAPGRVRPETLRRLAEEFVTRDGTDYGDAEKTLDEKVTALLRALEEGDAAIRYDTVSETFNIVSRR